VVVANLQAAAAPGISGQTMNVACGERTSLLDLLDAISSSAGRTVEPVFGPPRPGDIEHSMADITLARSLLGYRVQVAFAQGIQKSVEWYQAERRGDG
jgi:nucleoside-diphosphate-sugar epimerase